ncbi:cysteine hydrolase [Archangium minus]|uniref:Cysteine hydrolase n=1 Tax=Archangium minus TaxID=83450 RepID=A0ABY9X540_9BACT|nr:cysteine hydrolase [Archangium minus]
MGQKVLVVVDVQREYVTPGRAFHIASIGPSLENGRRVLETARSKGWPIYHVRHLQAGAIFNQDDAYSGFVQGFEPQGDEREIHKGNFSCYSAPDFAEAMSRHAARGDEVIIIGYGSTMCCLSTIIEGYHRGQKMVFVSDASRAKASARLSEESLHAHATDIISTYARVVTTQQLVGEP